MGLVKAVIECRKVRRNTNDNGVLPTRNVHGNMVVTITRDISKNAVRVPVRNTQRIEPKTARIFAAGETKIVNASGPINAGTMRKPVNDKGLKQNDGEQQTGIARDNVSENGIGRIERQSSHEKGSGVL